jgi:general secretion pathway protein N
MMPFRAIASHRLSTILVGVCGIALVTALSQGLSVRQQDIIGTDAGKRGPTDPASASAQPSTGEASSANPIPRGNPLWASPLSSLTAARERPLFSPSRRAPAALELASVPPQRPVTVSPPRLPLLALVGTIAGETQGIAILFDETTKGIVRLRMGEAHSGWTLRSVTRREATLQRDRETAILALSNRPAK